jgi:hypothetical protein
MDLVEHRRLLNRKGSDNVKEWVKVFDGNITEITKTINFNKLPSGESFEFDEVVFEIKPVLNNTGSFVVSGITTGIALTTANTSADTALSISGHMTVNPIGIEGIVISENKNGSIKSEIPNYFNKYSRLSGKITSISFYSTTSASNFTTDTTILIYGR